MSVLVAMSARRRIVETGPLVYGDPGADTTPYALPTASPYNVAHLTVPTPDATGQATHPSVVDFQHETGARWNGYRYWMAYTPYAGSDATRENPCVAASHDGYTWYQPHGISNPIDPYPGVGNYNSDTELGWDAGAGRLWLMWRESAAAETVENLYVSWSTDGSTWAAPALVLTSTTKTALLSPALVKMPDGWRMFCIGYGQPSTVRTATTPLGPWSAPTTLTIPDTFGTPWHVDVIHDGTAYRMLLSTRSWKLGALSSADGITWTAGTDVLANRPAEWDQMIYRSTMTPHENGTHFRLWYAAARSGQWWLAYSQVARTHWPA